jgi:hypothetical protein
MQDKNAAGRLFSKMCCPNATVGGTCLPRSRPAWLGIKVSFSEIDADF